MISFGPNVDGFHDVADQMRADLGRRAEACFRARDRERDELTSVARFEAYRDRARASFIEAMGGLPEERGPLNSRSTGRISREGFTLEKLIFESLPGVFVTALLYRPDPPPTRAPAVLFLHGHADSGKAFPEYQRACTALVRNGFIVLAPDPPGQGERSQILDPETGAPAIHGCTNEHSYCGLPFVAIGASVARQFVWDAVRSIDLLESLPDVDASRIGVTGNSGGGLQTCLLMRVESRLAAAMPCTFVTALEPYLATGQPQDAEQIVYGAIARGPDHDEYLTAMAPRPVRVGAVAYDFFPIEGTRIAVRRAKAVYALYGADAMLDLVVDPSVHTYSRGLRRAAVGFFRARLAGEGSVRDDDGMEPLPEEELRVLPGGQVSRDLPGARTVFDLARNAARGLPAPAPAVRAASPEAMRARIRSVLGVPDSTHGPVDARVLAEGEWDGWRARKLFFLSEPGIVVTAVRLDPPGTGEGAADLVLLPNGTSDAEIHAATIRRRLESGRAVLLLDVRGTGAVEAREFNNYGRHRTHGTEYRMAMDAMMLGISTLGLRVFDALRGIQCLQSASEDYRTGVVGMGRAAPIALFTAALEPTIDEVTIIDGLVSYRSILEVPWYDSELCTYPTTPWGIAREFDVVDLLPLLAPRPTTFVRPRWADGSALSEEQWEARFLRPARERGYLSGGWTPRLSDESEG